MTNSSLSRRLAALEAAYARSPGSAGGDGSAKAESLAKKFMSGVLNAIGHIRRSEIDRYSAWGYRREKLRNLGPFSLAQYVAALRACAHEDEDEARQILKQQVNARGVDPTPLEKLINLADRVISSQRREDGSEGS